MTIGTGGTWRTGAQARFSSNGLSTDPSVEAVVIMVSMDVKRWHTIPEVSQLRLGCDTTIRTGGTWLATAAARWQQSVMYECHTAGGYQPGMESPEEAH